MDKRLVAPSVLMAVLVPIMLAATPLMSAASGQPRIVQTGCDTLSVSPPRFRVQFRVENLSESPICNGIRMFPLPPDSTPPGVCSAPILQCGSPTGWVCGAENGEAFWYPVDWAQCIAPGTALGSFSIVSDGFSGVSSCCYRAAFLTPIPESSVFVDICFTCDQPVPVRPGTWGQLKQLYR